MSEEVQCLCIEGCSANGDCPVHGGAANQPPQKVKRTAGSRVRCMWVVQAGIVPEHVLPEYTRQWILTSETYYAEAESKDEAVQFKTFKEFRQEASDYARDINDPRYVNWVKLEYMYF